MLLRIVLALCLLSCASAKTVIMLGDGNVQNVQQFNFNLFDPFDQVTNMGLQGLTIEGLRDSLTTPYPYPPDYLMVMVGMENLRNGFSTGILNIDSLIEAYNTLFEKLETMVPSTTKILIVSVLPFDSTGYADSFRTYVMNTIGEFNTKLADAMWSRERSESYSFIYAFDYMQTSDKRLNRALFQPLFNQYTLLNYEGYNVLKQALTDTLNYNESEDNTGVVHGPNIAIRTNTYGLFHYTYFQVYVDGVLIGNYANTETIRKVFAYQGSGNIEIVVSTW